MELVILVSLHCKPYTNNIMNNEFTFELLAFEPGLESTLSEEAYLKLPASLRSKYIVREEKEEESDNFFTKQDDGFPAMEDENGIPQEDTGPAKKFTLPWPADYDQL